MRNPATMTNRELQTELDRTRNQSDRLRIASEMARRLNSLDTLSADPREERIRETSREFQHWKLNGAGDEYR